MSKRWTGRGVAVLFVLVVGLSSLVWQSPTTAEPPKTTKTTKAAQPTQPGTGQRATFMRLKLEPVKDLLEGIVLEDFDRVIAATERIHLLSLDESWMVIQTDEYRRESDEFRRSVKLLAAAAKDHNIDGATLGYTQMTFTCVRCHRLLRPKQ